MRDGIIVGVEYALRIGIDEGIHRSRIEAFGAIRRAAAEARECDAAQRAFWDVGDGQNAFVWSCRASSVRRAIRAAIGTEKSHDISSTRTEYRA